MGETNSYSSDTSLINNYIKECQTHIYIDPDKTLLITDTILSLSIKNNYRHGIFKAHNIKGCVYSNSHDLDLAHESFIKAMPFATLNDDPRNKALLLGNIGLIYRYRFNHDSSTFYLRKVIEYTDKHNIPDLNTKALFDLSTLYLQKNRYIETAEILFKTKEKAEEIKDTTLLMFIHNLYGVLYSQVNKFNLSLNHYLKAIKISETNQELDIRSAIYINIGELYFDTKQNYDSAKYYYQLSNDFAPSHQKKSSLFFSNINIGNVFFVKKKYDSAIVYYKNAINNPLIDKYPKGKAAVVVNLGNYYLSAGNRKLASEYLNSGYEISKELGVLLYLKNALQGLYKLDSLNNNFIDAIKYYQEFHRVSDSLQSDLAKNKMVSLEFEKNLANQKYNNELLIQQNELKNIQIATQKKLIWFVILGSVVLFALLMILYRHKSKIKLLHSQLSDKHHDLLSANEELNSSNESLINQKDQLKDLNHSKDKFLAILGHDLKSPFVSLLGMLNLLDEDWEEIDDKEKHSIIKKLFTTSQNNYQLLEDLLSWGKAQQGQIICKKETFYIRHKIEQLELLFQNQITNKNINVKINISAEAQVKSDPRLFIQIIQNLFNNAIKFTEPGGNILINAQYLKEETLICVEDDGIGIPEDKTQNIFSLKSNFNRPGTIREKSTGMGLIISKEFAKIIGGKLTVESEEGKGSVFCLSLPQ